ncbi:PJA2 ligase, partial [Hemiprocne comata]|nr:PJA2 ligase [Hemiprocne comata]
ASQEGGKLAWPRPAGGHHTMKGRRYQRGPAYVPFRLSLNSQGRDEHQHKEDCEQLESDNVQKENAFSCPWGQISSHSLNQPLLENIRTETSTSQSVPCQTSEVDTLPFSLVSNGLEGNTVSRNFINPYEDSEDLSEYASRGHNGLNGENGVSSASVDSNKPDSSDGEEDDAQDKFSLAREEAGVIPNILESMFSTLEKGRESSTDLQFPLSNPNHTVSRECCEAAGPMPLMSYFSIDSDLACSNNRMFTSFAEDQAIQESNQSGANCETKQIETADAGIRTSTGIANEFNVCDGNAAQGSLPELVVRPKIRKQNAANQLEGVNLVTNNDEEEGGSWMTRESAEVQQGSAVCALQNRKKEVSSSMLFESREYRGHRKNPEIDLGENAAAQGQKGVLVDSTSWNEFEHYSRRLSKSHKDEDSSQRSDGGWSTAVPSSSTATKEDLSLSGKTFSGREEHEPEVQSSGSGVEEENAVADRDSKQTLLEEGGIASLQHQEQVGSSSDQEDDPVSDLVRPGFFLLDDNNNLEDDSNVSEDLDAEWSAFDEFDGLGLPPEVPFMDPRFLTFVVVEGRIQQAVESTLASLEHLGLVVEQTHPPATKAAIDRLPQIIVTDKHDGQQHCCTICWCDYVQDEIITELPCHHLFHKSCVTLWLQKSGTCPVCRHVLDPVLPEAAAGPVPFLSDHDPTYS